MRQDQFLEVIDRDEAERRFRSALTLSPLGEEVVSLDEAWGRVLSQSVIAEINVPSFDRSNVDGFAVRAADTYGAGEETPRRLKLLPETLATGCVPKLTVESGTGVSIATGGMMPRGADAVVMVEHAEAEGDELIVRKAATPGAAVTFAGTDISAGETILHRGEILTSRETGVLAAIGKDKVSVWRKPRVAILSTGDEIIEPGEPMQPGLVFDSNARILADAVKELGGEPLLLGIVKDDLPALRAALKSALRDADVVLLSGGTSKGEGDLSYHAVSEFQSPGILAHGVALKPGKPICLAVQEGKPVVILPGFPTSAIFTFHEFVAPVIRLLGGRREEARATQPATMAVRVNSETGRTEYLLVGLVQGAEGLSAYPLGKGSGSVTTFSRADGFVTIGRQQEILTAGQPVEVQLLARDLQLADLVVIGSHCVGLDWLLGEMVQQGWRVKFLAVGSTAGLQAAERGECDVAGIHLFDMETGRYNVPFLTPDLRLLTGYGRRQGVLYRPGDARFENQTALSAIQAIKADPNTVMVNRNQGSGTRVLLDRILGESRPPGYAVQAKSHHAVATAIAQGRADWGMAIDTVAAAAGLEFLPYQNEQYDFVIPASRWDRPPVKAFRELLDQPEVQAQLHKLGFV